MAWSAWTVEPTGMLAGSGSGIPTMADGVSTVTAPRTGAMLRVCFATGTGAAGGKGAGGGNGAQFSSTLAAPIARAEGPAVSPPAVMTYSA